MNCILCKLPAARLVHDKAFMWTRYLILQRLFLYFSVFNNNHGYSDGEIDHTFRMLPAARTLPICHAQFILSLLKMLSM